MNRALFIGTLTAGLGVFTASYAQAPQAPRTPPVVSAPPITAPQPAATATTVTLSPGQVFAIGGGAVVGAILLDVLLPARIAYIIGGLGGAYLGNTWYNEGLK